MLARGTSDPPEPGQDGEGVGKATLTISSHFLGWDWKEMPDASVPASSSSICGIHDPPPHHKQARAEIQANMKATSVKNTASPLLCDLPKFFQIKDCKRRSTGGTGQLILLHLAATFGARQLLHFDPPGSASVQIMVKQEKNYYLLFNPLSKRCYFFQDALNSYDDILDHVDSLN